MNGCGKRSGKRSAVLVAGLLVVLGMFGTSVAWADNANPQVAPIGSRPYGQTYGQWSARWWQFAVQQPSLDFCAPAKPQSPVMFLAGTGGIPPVTTSCTIPTGQSIMFPLFNVEWSVAEAQAQLQLTPGQSCFVPAPLNGTDDAALQACATAGADHVSLPGAVLAAEVDSRTLSNLTSYRAVSPPFDFTAANGNPFAIPPGPTHAVADGFWIILTPLSAGTHTIHFTATVPFPDLGFTFALDQTYRLTVQGSRS
jgi:hypothetical protein